MLADKFIVFKHNFSGKHWQTTRTLGYPVPVDAKGHMVRLVATLRVTGVHLSCIISQMS